jgi:hypothetical protein
MKKMNMEKINELKILQIGGNDFVKEVTKAHNNGAKRVLFSDWEKLENIASHGHLMNEKKWKNSVWFIE